MPGFDLTQGLRRLQGNRRFYKKLLLNFAANYSQAAAEIRQALDDSDFARAAQLLHSLKGVCANLSIVDLQQATAGLENLVKIADYNKPPEPDALAKKLVILENELDQALKATQTFGPAGEEKIPVPATDRIATLPLDLAKNTARRLRDAAEMGDVTEVVSISEDIASRSEAFAPYKAKIKQLADEFDFEGILKLAGELEKISDT